MFHTHFYLDAAFVKKNERSPGTLKKQQHLEIEECCIKKHPTFYSPKD
jgi:hypothetical protein